MNWQQSKLTFVATMPAQNYLSHSRVFGVAENLSSLRIDTPIHCSAAQSRLQLACSLLLVCT